WASLPLLDAVRLSGRFRTLAARISVFTSLYMCVILFIVPALAPLGGRVSLPWFAFSEIPLRPANIGYCLLARNYVAPRARDILQRVAVSIDNRRPGAVLTYLDANFPFFNGFPLLPHLSHKDGKKVDLAFFYRDAKTGKPLNKTPSPIGYWAYERPREREPRPCENVRAWLRWDFHWLQP
ncbi:MAG: hypothetical protein GY859_42700, partial [Desulfobacterales bacterium]|nr:hypothetical protein [Desulfobacterales bacterium]